MSTYRSEQYTHGHDAVVIEQHAKRTAEEAASFLLPELAPGSTLLDIGCGPGTITVGLARRIAPANAVGIDASTAIVGLAAREAANEQVLNASFLAGDLYRLPYRDGSFDVVYAHQVLQHLNRPGDALVEAWRVLRPDGLVAVREVDWCTAAAWPPETAMDRFLKLYQEVSRRNGGDPCVGRRLRALLHESGFPETRVGASVWCFADTDAVREWGYSWARRLMESSVGARALEFGLASKDGLGRLAEGLKVWGEHPDAFFSFTHAEALGWRE